MAKSSIEWTDVTWNPVAGCSIISAGCTNCYAMSLARRLEAMHQEKYCGLTRRSGQRTIWNNVVRTDEKALDIPFTWRLPRNVFVNSMSDLFHELVPDDFICKIWNVMASTPQHNYQILTKRPDRMAHFLRSRIDTQLKNVWLGTSVEDDSVRYRVDEIRNISATVRFISFEPLIGSVGQLNLEGIHWAIVGGESGSSARQIQEKWIDEIHELCIEFQTKFFFKQWGSWGVDNKKRSKKANGRLYKGRHWNEMPKLTLLSGKSAMARKNIDWSGGAILPLHSKAKLTVLERYFAEYLRVRCRNPFQPRFVLTVVDGFCGAGIYNNGEHGSPIIFLDTLRKVCEEINIYRRNENLREISIECLFIFNDKDRSVIETLNSNLQPFIASCNATQNLVVAVEKMSVDFQSDYYKINQILERSRITKNVLFNLDQCGYSLVEPKLIRDLLTRYRSAEAILTFSIQSLLSYLPSQASLRNKILEKFEVDVTKLDDIEELTGKSEKKGSIERLVFEAFKGCAPYVSPFAINNPEGWRYWLMHFSNQYKARQVYNDLLHEIPNVQGHIGRSGLRMLQYDSDFEISEYLFRGADRKSALSQLMADIPKSVAEFGGAVSVNDFIESICNETPAHSKDILNALVKNPELQVITENGKPRRSIAGVKRTDHIEMEKQRSFHHMPRLIAKMS